MRAIDMRRFGSWLSSMRQFFFTILCLGFSIARTDGSTRVDLGKFAGETNILTEKIEVRHDGVFKSRKHYRGIDIRRLFEHQGITIPEKPAQTSVVFHCSDGYTAITTLDLLLRDKAFLAVADLDAPKGQHWFPLPSGGGREPGPFYLVWPNTEPDDIKHPWPYNLTAIEIAGTEKILGPATPAPNAGLDKGFDLFRIHCMSCHSVNGVGGTVGVELNIPRSVFEYWKPEMLPEFIADPRSFRRNGKMPGFAHLNQAEIRRILDYLRHMKDRKKHAAAP